MRILHILDHSLPLHSGYSFRTAAILREQRALGWETHQLTTPRHRAASSTTETVDSLTFHRTPFRHGLLSRIPSAGTYIDEMHATGSILEQMVDRVRPDLLHAHSPVLAGLPALRVARRKGLPLVYEIRALWEDGAVDHGTTRTRSLRYALSRWMETFVLKRADHVTTICEGLASEIAARGVLADRITLIPNAVDTNAFVFDPVPDADLQKRLGLRDKIVIGFIGSFYGYEGLELLIDAFARMVRRRSNISLVLVGGGIREEALKARANEHALGDHVRFVGRVPHGDVAKYYSIIDLLIYPRLPVRVTELVTPLKPLEAMAQGRVLIASDVGGHRELIRHDDNGFLFRAGSLDGLVETIETAVARRNDWGAMKLRARRFVERERTWKLSVAKYAAVYDKVLHDSAAMPKESAAATR
jgi:PEP-CTERM/exosortase A-associated glycosyltransferase